MSGDSHAGLHAMSRGTCLKVHVPQHYDIIDSSGLSYRYRQTAKIGKAMSGPTAEVLASLRGKLEGFQEHLPLIKALRNPGLRDRHWDKISQSEPRSLSLTSLTYTVPCLCYGSSMQAQSNSLHPFHDQRSGSQNGLPHFADT